MPNQLTPGEWYVTFPPLTVEGKMYSRIRCIKAVEGNPNSFVVAGKVFMRDEELLFQVTFLADRGQDVQFRQVPSPEEWV